MTNQQDDTSAPATKADIQMIIANMASKDDIANMATKDDIANMATKDDIANMATKDDIKIVYSNMATKDDIKRIYDDMPTKDDPKGLATKDDIAGINKRLDSINAFLSSVLKCLSHNVDRLDGKIDVHDKRLKTLEAAL